jgi:CRP-like cAMP-binding protein
MSAQNYNKGDIILQEGTKGDEMYFVSRGKVNVFKIIDEEKVDLGQLGEEEFFGEMSLVLNDPRTASVEALEDTEIKGYSKETFINLIKEDPDVAMDVIEKFARRLKDAHGTISKLVGEKKCMEIIYKKKD